MGRCFLGFWEFYTCVRSCGPFGRAIELHASDLAKAEDRYKHTDFEGSLSLLDKHSADASTNFLVARDYFMLGEFKKASDYLERPSTNSRKMRSTMDWLGRAYGKRAETSNPLMAPGLHPKRAKLLRKPWNWTLKTLTL